jgi:crotonobetainyl-CoA:carnitine CoA-transferase CaiB-like acyl-CoA transferase
MDKCLDGLLVMEFSEGWSAGALCSRLLADLGATVVKIESPAGDPLRARPPGARDGESPTFQCLNTNKRSIALDFKAREGEVLLKELLKKADVFLEDIYSPPDRTLSLTYDMMALLNPRLVYCSFSPLGRKGPLCEYVGDDLIAQTMSGVVATTGNPGRIPNKAGPPFANHVCAVLGGIAILAALNERENSGLGQEIDMALYDAMVAYLYTFIPGYFISGKAPERSGNRHPMTAPWDSYQAKDGWVIICMGDTRQWHSFLRLIERQDLIDNPKYKTNDERTQPGVREEVEKMVADWVNDKTISEVIKILEKEKIPSGPIYSIEQALQDKQFLSRDMVVEMKHPLSGIYHTFGSIFKMSATPGRLETPSPLLGQHTRSLLKELCRLSAEHLSALEEKGILVMREE